MNAFRRAQLGWNPKPATQAQLDYLARLSEQLGVETPRVAWARDASRAIRGLIKYRDSRAQMRLALA